MNVHALPSLAAAIGCFAIGVASWTRRSSPSLPRAFCVYAIVFATTYFVNFNQMGAESLEGATPWVVAGGAVWPFVVPTLWRFATAFAEQQRLVRRLPAILLFDVVAVALAMLALVVEPFRRTPHLYSWGWGHVHEPTFGLYGLALAWLLVAAVVMVTIVVRFVGRTTEPRRRKQAMFGLAGGVWMVAVWFAFKRALPALGYDTQWLSPLGVLGQIAVLGYAIWRFDMFELSSPQVAEDVLRKMQDGVLLADASHTIVDANPAACRMLGYGAGELDGVPVARVLVGLTGAADEGRRPSSSEPDRSGALKRQRSLASLTRMSFACRTKQGGDVPVSLSTIRFGEKAWAHTVYVLNDLSSVLKRASDLEEANRSLRREIGERKRAESALEERDAQLRQAQKMEAVGQLAGGVAHDFNNMLTVIRGFADLVDQELDEDDELRRDFGEILTACDRASALVRQLLAFSRRQVLRPVVTDLNHQVRDLTKMLGRLLGEDVELVTELASDVPNVEVDTAQLAQVLMNLAVNARDAMPNGGKLTIRTGARRLSDASPSRLSVPAGHYAVLEVRDEGSGMPPEVVERIFEPFYTTKRAGVGTGLGLSTVYGIVKQSGGDITVESRPDEGTTFTILLPEGTESAPKSTDRRRPHTVPNSRETVLLVEDEEQVRRLAKRILVSRGYRVLEAATADAALRLAGPKERRIDLVVTDVVMPGMNGLELGRRLGAERPDLRILYTTGYSYEELSSRGLVPDDIRIVGKPFSPASLLEGVCEVLAAGRSGQQTDPGQDSL